MPEVVGRGLIDQTSGPLTAPDVDLSIKWEITRHLGYHQEIVPTDDGASGQLVGLPMVEKFVFGD